MSDGKPRTDYTRDELISSCERGVVPQERWHNRDSANAQRQLGEVWALLRAGCDFAVLSDTDEDTIWIEVVSHGFDWFEMNHKERAYYYIPTLMRLDRASGADWY